MDRIREEFECFYKDHMRSQGERDFVINEQIESFKGGRSSYGYSDIQEYWLFWQASRKAIKVELPSHVNDVDSAPMLYASVAKQLTEAGIKAPEIDN